MIVVIVRYSPRHVPTHDDKLLFAGIELQDVISEALTCEEEKVGIQSESKVQLFFEPQNTVDLADFGALICIEATDFPSRRANLQERVKMIGEKARSLFPDTTVAVWVKLIQEPGLYEST